MQEQRVSTAASVRKPTVDNIILHTEEHPWRAVWAALAQVVENLREPPQHSGEDRRLYAGGDGYAASGHGGILGP